MRRIALQRGGHRQRRVARKAVEGIDLLQRERGRGQGAGLVEHEGVDRGQRFQCVGAQHEHAAARERIGGCGKRRRQREGQCTRTADHEHGQGDLERALRLPVPPDGEDQHGRNEQRDHEMACDAIGRAHEARTLRLRLTDEPHELGQVQA
ncbi:MAG TPA: hypothetical protein VM847_11695, partial [Tahibacter sp.]|nr:hypothetical protein [Tahibacter sp.]